jgi:hypothetical protein
MKNSITIMKKQIILLFVTILFVTLNSFSAIAQSTQEFSVYAGGGLSTLKYSLSEGKINNGWGCDFGMAYSYFFNEYFGVNTGLGFASYNAKIALNDATTIVTPNLKDNEGDTFDMHTTLDSYDEKQNTMFLNIPVMLQYQTGKTNKFYAQGGVKIGIPLSGSYKTPYTVITNKGYYPEFDNWATTQKFAGFGAFVKQESDSDLDLKVSFMLSAEAGMKWLIGNNLRFYTGIYFDYGLNDLVGTHNKPFIDYNTATPTNISSNSLLESLTDKVSNLAIGVKIKLAFETKSKRTSGKF